MNLRPVFALLALCVAVPLVAAEPGAERLKADYDAALGVTFPETPALDLRDALLRLRAKPDSTLDFEAVVRFAGVEGIAPALAPAFSALEALNAAASQDLSGYRAALARLKGQTQDARILRAADVSDALVVCRECRGDLRCRVCGGTGKCPDCKGRGYSARRARSADLLGSGDARKLGGASLRSGGSAGGRLRCSDCGGTGKCPECQGVPKRCPVCGTSGKVPDPERARERLARLAGQAADHLGTTLADTLAAREQTELLAADLRKARGIADPKAALDFLAGLPAERVKAAQWSQFGLVRADLEAMVRQHADQSAEREAERAALRAAVKAAQRKEDPMQGLVVLLEVFETYADCDALPEAKTAFDGLVAAAQGNLRLRNEALSDRINALSSLSVPADRLAQAQACLRDWPEEDVPKALVAYAKANRNDALERLLKDTTLDTLRARVERVRREAEQAQAEAEAKPAWWVWAAAGVGGLVVLYALWSVVAGVLERRAEAKRKAANRAAIDSIRNTFAHRRDRR